MPAGDQHSTTPLTQGGNAHRWQPALLIALLAMLATWPSILSGDMTGRGAWDDLQFHWPAIQQIAVEIPAPNLSDYASATTPGYHLLLAPFVRLGASHTTTQLIASSWTIVLVALLTWHVAATCGRRAAIIVLPLLASMYVLSSGIWLLPDNAGWLGVLTMILLALRRVPARQTLVFAALILLILVSARQVHVWTAAPLWLSAWMGSTTNPFSFRLKKSRISRVLLALVCTLPSFALIAWFISIWDGLVPPRFQHHHQGINPATPGFLLLETTIISVFFAPLLVPRLLTLWRTARRWIVLAAAVGLLLGLLPESIYSVDAGRYSGWWNIIDRFPAFAHRSPIYALGSLAGALTLTAWLSMLTARDRWILLSALLAFAAAQTVNHTVWQRYHEPMLLIFIILTLARSNAGSTAPRRTLWCSALLAAALGALSFAKLLSAQPITQSALPTPAPQTPAPATIPAP